MDITAAGSGPSVGGTSVSDGPDGVGASVTVGVGSGACVLIGVAVGIGSDGAGGVGVVGIRVGGGAVAAGSPVANGGATTTAAVAAGVADGSCVADGIGPAWQAGAAARIIPPARAVIKTASVFIGIAGKSVASWGSCVSFRLA